MTHERIMFACWTRVWRTRVVLKAIPRTCLLALCLSGWMGGRANATTALAQREGRACQYCHTSGSPGTIDVATGTRQANELNMRGLYYSRHNYSFAGYVELMAPRAAAPAPLRLVSRDALPDSARRIAVADVTGDHILRLITLNEKPDVRDSSVLTVKKWDGKTFVTEFRADTPGTPDKLAVGRFTPDGRTVIVTSQAVWAWNGKTYISKVSPQPMNIMGTVRLPADPADSVLTADATGELWGYSINATGGGDVLTNGRRFSQVSGGGIARLEVRGTPEFFARMQIESTLTQAGIFGLVADGKNGGKILYHVDPDQDSEPVNAAVRTGAQAAPKITGWKVGVNDLSRPSLANQNFTPRLEGSVYDVATQDPRGGTTPGLLVLTSSTPEGKGRNLYFFALNTPAPR